MGEIWIPIGFGIKKIHGDNFFRHGGMLSPEYQNNIKRTKSFYEFNDLFYINFSKGTMLQIFKIKTFHYANKSWKALRLYYNSKGFVNFAWK